MAVYAAWDAGEARALIEARRAEKGAVLPILHALQEYFGYIDAGRPADRRGAQPVPRRDPASSAFYHDFRRAPTTQPC